MHEQLGHLLSMGKRRNIIVQITPFSAVYRAQHKGNMTLLGLPGGSEYLYSESLGRGHFTDDPAQLTQRSRSFERLGAEPLSAPASRELIGGAMDELLNTGGHQSAPFTPPARAG